MKHAVSLVLTPEQIIEGVAISPSAKQYFTGVSFYDFDSNAHLFRFVGNKAFPVHEEGCYVSRVSLQELEELCSAADTHESASL